MKTIKMNISELKHPEKNVRRHTAKQIHEITRSIKMFGQFRPVVIDENNIILAGNGLILGMKEMGITEVDVLKYDNLTDKQKKKLMIADNQIASLGNDDFDVIEEFIRELDGDLDVPGFDEDMLKNLVMDEEEIDEAIMNYGTFPADEIQYIKENEGYEMKPVGQTYQAPERKSVMDNIVSSQPTNAHEIEVGTYETPVDMRKFVICPNCGEKIYI